VGAAGREEVEEEEEEEVEEEEEEEEELERMWGRKAIGRDVLSCFVMNCNFLGSGGCTLLMEF
jgi:hypothetical protein